MTHDRRRSLSRARRSTWTRETRRTLFRLTQPRHPKTPPVAGRCRRALRKRQHLEAFSRKFQILSTFKDRTCKPFKIHQHFFKLLGLRAGRAQPKPTPVAERRRRTARSRSQLKGDLSRNGQAWQTCENGRSYSAASVDSCNTGEDTTRANRAGASRKERARRSTRRHGEGGPSGGASQDRRRSLARARRTAWTRAREDPEDASRGAGRRRSPSAVLLPGPGYGSQPARVGGAALSLAVLWVRAASHTAGASSSGVR